MALSDLLKQVALPIHAEVETLPFVKALVDGSLPLQSYISQLRAMHKIHTSLDTEITNSNIDALIRFHFSRPSRTTMIKKDLEILGYSPESVSAQRLTHKICQDICLTRMLNPDCLIGYVYVLEGMTLGNVVHKADLHSTFGSSLRGADNYYNGYGHETTRYWQECVRWLDSFVFDSSKVKLLEGIVSSFMKSLKDLYASLYPFSTLQTHYTAMMLNPEAGNHPVPQDTLLIDAAQKAGQRCLQEFPYFIHRYGQRGRLFTLSDVAWLVTLTALPVEGLIQQVKWLRSVLSNRGMPSITLQRQLVYLHDELSQICKSDEYDKLLIASDELKAQRQAIISDEDFKRLAKDFYQVTAGELAGECLNTGKLIISSVCDEQIGMSNAVSSLRSWLTDENRFNNSWIDEVNRLYDKVYAIIRQSKSC